MFKIGKRRKDSDSRERPAFFKVLTNSLSYVVVDYGGVKWWLPLLKKDFMIYYFFTKCEIVPDELLEYKLDCSPYDIVSLLILLSLGAGYVFYMFFDNLKMNYEKQ